MNLLIFLLGYSHFWGDKTGLRHDFKRMFILKQCILQKNKIIVVDPLTFVWPGKKRSSNFVDSNFGGPALYVHLFFFTIEFTWNNKEPSNFSLKQSVFLRVLKACFSSFIS